MDKLALNMNDSEFPDSDGIIKKVKVFAERAAAEFDVIQVILFGSFAHNRQDENSDIDVAVIIKDSDVNLIDSEFLLYKMRRDIDYRIEPLLFIGLEDKSGFLGEILRTGKVIYGPAK